MTKEGYERCIKIRIVNKQTLMYNTRSIKFSLVKVNPGGIIEPFW